MYSTETGRFLTRDFWQGDNNKPLSLNKWNYVEGNPVNFSDPSGYCKSDDQDCINKATEIVNEFPNIKINMGNDNLLGCLFENQISSIPKHWQLSELTDVQIGLRAITKLVDSQYRFTKIFGDILLARESSNIFAPNSMGFF